MNKSEQADVQSAENPQAVDSTIPQSGSTENVDMGKLERLETRRWWLKLVVQPALLLVCAAFAIAGLGVAQRLGWISAGGHVAQTPSGETDAKPQYICPMMCTPPQSEPGRCPVCAMELVQAADSGGGDKQSIEIDPVARRVANIRTAPAVRSLVSRTVKAVGRLRYDEGSLATISAYVDGRLERMYADYEGVFVRRGDSVAMIYSPKLYSSQVEFLLAKKAYEDSHSSSLTRVKETNQELYESSRERLSELGMTDEQIERLAESGKANSRLKICAPTSGTVIDKLAKEGDYVKEGQPIYKLADLSAVWLTLDLFPEDAATVRYGQKVEARVQSLPDRVFTGRVAFVDPTVDPETRTVGVRIVMPNPEGRLLVGDFAKAQLEVPLWPGDGPQPPVYDLELAGKWIGRRHPHVVQKKPGDCPVCGDALVPATEFGFSESPTFVERSLVVPRSAVLMAGGNSVLYVETQPGRFEIRRVTLGPSCGDRIVILEGVEEDERVATSGNFLIDSQMQLAGNPSLIDPSKADDTLLDDAGSPEVLAALSELSPADRELAEAQRICPVTKAPLGSMGAPIKLDVDGEPVFICCQGCREALLAEPKKYLAILADNNAANLALNEHAEMDLPPIGAPRIVESQTVAPPIETPKIVARDQDAADEARAPDSSGKPAAHDGGENDGPFASLSGKDRKLAEKQEICPVTKAPLGSMGPPIKVKVDGRVVFICCEGCRERLMSDPDKYLARVSEEPLQ